MKRLRLPVLLIALAISGRTLAGKDLQVRLFTAQLPARMEIMGAGGPLHWKECGDCPALSEPSLAIEAAGGDVAIRSDNGRKVTELRVSGPYVLRPVGAAPMSAGFPLRIRATAGELLIIASVPLEEYVEGVLSAEGASLQNDESLKALAVAIRSYAEKFPGRHAADGFDFCDDTHCQVFRWGSVSDRIKSAALATRSEILRYRGSIAATYYHQDCGGHLSGANEVWPEIREPYLAAHPDPYCTVSGGLKWETALSGDEISRSLSASGISAPADWKVLEVSARSPSGRARTLKLSGGNLPPLPISANAFRFAVGRALGWNKIRSDFYEVRSYGGHVVFSGRGSGHGVGLCQAGAQEMGREGKTYRQILSFYYPGTEVSAVHESTTHEEWQLRSSERIELLSKDADAESSILPLADRILREDETVIGWKLGFRVRLQVFPSLDEYRDTTGQPGWVAASTRGHTVRLQPLVELRRKGVLESTLRHEFYHLLVEAHARENTPLWFREGLVLYLSDANTPTDTSSAVDTDQIEAALSARSSRVDLERAYAGARAHVREMVEQNGLQQVLNYLSAGIRSAAGDR